MSRGLAPPLRDVAPVRVDDMTVRRLWQGVQTRRSGRRAHPPRRSAFLWFALGALAGTLFTLSVRWLSLRAETPVAIVVGPVTHADGRPFGVTPAPDDASMDVALSDGSRIALSPGARLEPVENSARAVSLRLPQGTVVFDVRPGGPRRWSIDCGLATVEVVGTSFTLARSATRLSVEVARGVVLVRGERVPDHVQRLSAGAKLEITVPVDTAAPPPTASPPVAAPVPAAAPANRPTWRELSTRGEYADAYHSLGRSGISVASAESHRVDELMTLADVARLSGHPEDAITPLERVQNEFAADPRASLAAFTLGKIQLTRPGGAAAAAAAFRAALRLGLPSSLIEDAYGNAVEALVRSRDDEGARATALEYSRLFPTSRRAAALGSWASQR
jgi:transmembrane sensor